MTNSFLPPCVATDAVIPALRHQGYAVLDAQSVAKLAGLSLADLDALLPSWDDLPPD